MSGSLTARLASFTARAAAGTLLFGALGAALHGVWGRMLATAGSWFLGLWQGAAGTALTAVPAGIRVEPGDPALPPFVYSTLDPHLSAPLFLAILVALPVGRGIGVCLRRLAGGIGVLFAVHLAALVTEAEFRPLVAAGFREPVYYVYRFAWWVVCVWSILLLPAIAALYVYLVDWMVAEGRAAGRGWRRPAALAGACTLLLLGYSGALVALHPERGSVRGRAAPGDGLETLSGGASPADAAAAFRAGRYEEAATRFRDILARDPLDQAARHSLGVALYRQGRLDEALRELEAAARARPDLPGLDVSLGAVLFDLGRTDEALASFRRADLSAVSDPALLLQIGGALFRAGDAEAADRAYQRLLGLDPENAAARYNQANVAMTLGRDEEAIARFEAIAREHPGAEVHNNLGVLYARRGRPQDAERAYRDTLRLDPDNVPAAYNLGMLLARGERRCEAIPLFQTCADADQGNVAVRCADLAQRLASACSPRR